MRTKTLMRDVEGSWQAPLAVRCAAKRLRGWCSRPLRGQCLLLLFEPLDALERALEANEALHVQRADGRR